MASRSLKIRRYSSFASAVRSDCPTICATASALPLNAGIKCRIANPLFKIAQRMLRHTAQNRQVLLSNPKRLAPLFNERTYLVFFH